MATKPHHDADTEATELIHENGKDLFELKPRAFNIVWGNDPRYWRIPRSSRDDGNEVAELVQVSWLEVTGSVTLTALTKYQINFRLSFKGDAFGWKGSPVFLMAKVGKKGRYKWKKLKEFDNKLSKEPIDVPQDEPFVIEVPQQPDCRLYFGLYEVWSGKWKGGLRIHKAIVRQIN